MSWMAKLYETYEDVLVNDDLNKDLEPYFHKREQCHIEIIIDDNGNFIRAESLVKEISYGDKKYWKGENTIIPITPKSLTGRTSGAAPYPLAEQIQYIASDYPDYGGLKKSYFNSYFELLNSWVESDKYYHFKVDAVAKYVSKGTVVRDLLRVGILFAYKKDDSTTLIKKWAEQGLDELGGKKKLPKPPLFHAVNANEQGNAKVRWRVQRAGNPDDTTWNDFELVGKWQAFQGEVNKVNGFCQITGKECFVAISHPKGIVSRANDAKLISAPSDKTYLTYQGRFTSFEQPFAVSFVVSQKAHNVLRWLIERQGYPNNTQVYVSWAVSGKFIPEPLKSSWAMMTDEDILLQPEIEPEESHDRIDHGVDLGEFFAHKLNNYLRGYREKLEPNEQIVIMGVDSATTGRMGIIYYRELLASEFLDRIYDWHIQFSWPQRHTKEYSNSKNPKKTIKKTIWPVSTPVPRVIAEAAYGDILKSNKTLKKSLLERILPCIVDGRPFPRDVMIAAVRRVSNRSAYKTDKQWLWEEHLGVACALYRGFYMRHPDKTKRRKYKMALEEDRKTRDYLYGRLLAIAERIEEVALNVGGESRPTTAARLMQRFADRPFSTWRNIELGLQPYMQRLQGKRAGFLTNCKKELDTVMAAFSPDDFTSEKPLTGEFLLGYHCQKQDWRDKKETNNEN